MAGWYNRRKSGHFAAYHQVSKQFAELLGIDPWLIDPYFAVCNQVNFQEKVGEECLAAQVDFVLTQIRAKYAEYGVKHDPFVIVKADAGTYGMGIMTVKDASEVRDLNRKQRNKMAVVKEGLQVSDVLVQEGVYSFEDLNEAVAEPVVYMIDRYVVGGFYRVHTERGVDENLNAPGMRFEPLAFESCCAFPNPDCAPDDTPNRFYAYGVMARLAMLAASVELEALRHESKPFPRSGNQRIPKGLAASLRFDSPCSRSVCDFALAECGKEPFYQEQAYVFGTLVDVSIYGEDEAKRQAGCRW